MVAKGVFVKEGEPHCTMLHVGYYCRAGYVYIAKCNEFYKIGFSGNYTGRKQSITNRLHQLPIEHDGMTGTFIHGMESNCGRGLERHLHEHFRCRRIRGEFFDLTEDDLIWIKSLPSFNGSSVVHFDIL